MLICASCRRHVRESDEACPFCASAEREPTLSRSAMRLARDGVIVGTVVVALSQVGACHKSPTKVDEADARALVTVYGGPVRPPPDAGTD
jgi:hypothetical protein